MDQWAEREGGKQMQTRRRGGSMHAGRGGGGGGCTGRREVGVIYRPYFVRGARAEALQQPAQDHPILQGALQEGFRIRDGLLGRLQHPERYQPCHRLFRRIHVPVTADPLQQKRRCFLYSEPTPSLSPSLVRLSSSARQERA